MNNKPLYFKVLNLNLKFFEQKSQNKIEYLDLNLVHIFIYMHQQQKSLLLVWFG